MQYEARFPNSAGLDLHRLQDVSGPFVYIAEAIGYRPAIVKIGKSKNPLGRLRAIEDGLFSYKVKLNLLRLFVAKSEVVEGFTLGEALLQDAFCDLQFYPPWGGVEWYRLEGDLLHFVNFAPPGWLIGSEHIWESIVISMLTVFATRRVTRSQRKYAAERLVRAITYSLEAA